MMKRIIFIFLLFIVSSCNDFLDLSPISSRNVKDFYKNSDNFDSAIIGIYNTLKLPGVYGESHFYVVDICADNVTYNRQRGSANVYEYEFVDYNYSSLNVHISNYWRDHYVGISRANAVLDRINDIEFSNVDLKKQFHGEAKFLRALFYFNLVRVFGDVPLVLKEIISRDEGLALIRDPKDKVYEVIIEDLTEAISDLPLQYPPSEVGRATKGAAMVLLAKAYLTLKHYNKAINLLDEVISSGKYSLLTSYHDVFRPDNPNNAEIIFAVQYISGLNGQGSNLHMQMLPPGQGAAILGPAFGGGGIIEPTSDFVQLYEAGDQRKEWTVGEPFIDVSGVLSNDPYLVKYIQYGVQTNDSDSDLPLLRYADVLLMYAEALNEIGFGNPKATDYLNQIRKRAGINEINPATQQEFRRSIEKERRLELVVEGGHRWFDLLRTNRTMDVLGALGYNIKEHNLLHIIPQREIDISSKIVQNPGY